MILACRSGSVGTAEFLESTVSDSNSNATQKRDVLLMMKWEGCGDDPLRSCTVRLERVGAKKDDGSEELFILSPKGSVLYKEKLDSVRSVARISALRGDSRLPQLAVIATLNGSEIIRVLEYRSQKVVDAAAAIKFDDFGFMAEIVPQFRTGVNPAVEPYEIRLTDGVGLASPMVKTTKVFRYKDGRYIYAGEYRTAEAGDRTESLLKDSY